MPARTYMAVDDRRDHGFRVPRPDLSVAIGVPNACNGCHADRDAAWAAGHTAEWRQGAPWPPHFALAFDAAHRGQPGAGADLAKLVLDPAQPAIVRATALRWLGAALDADAVPALAAGLEDADPLVRAAAADAALALPAPDQVVALSPRLRDPVRLVRIEAARVLAPLAGRLSAASQRDLTAALDEYRSGQLLDADRPEARVNLGSLAARQGDLAGARREFEAALRVGPHFLPASLDLAEVHRQQGREADAERVLREALARVPEAESAEVHHALGLLLVRIDRLEEASAELARAAELAPESARFAYVHGIAQSSAGETEAAIRTLEAALRRHPGDPEILWGLATLLRDAGQPEAAREHARALLALRPGDPNAGALLRELGPAPSPSP
jgi:tetratricopeptide (TPR) repeat protein